MTPALLGAATDRAARDDGRSGAVRRGSVRESRSAGAGAGDRRRAGHHRCGDRPDGGGGRRGAARHRDPDATAAIERLDTKDSWAGLARVPGQAARRDRADAGGLRLPVGAAACRGAGEAEHIMLPAAVGAQRHGVECNAAALAATSKPVLAGLTERRTAGPIAWCSRRPRTLPELAARGVPGWALGAGGDRHLRRWRWGRSATAAAGWRGLCRSRRCRPDRCSPAARRGPAWRAAQELEIGVNMPARRRCRWRRCEWLAREWTPVGAGLGRRGRAGAGRAGAGAAQALVGEPGGASAAAAAVCPGGLCRRGLAVLATYAFAHLAAAVETTREKALARF